MVLDGSSIVAVVLKEPGYERLAVLIDEAEEVLVAAPSVLEAGHGPLVTDAAGRAPPH